MLYEYKWEEDINLSKHAPFCKTKECRQAHYRDGGPKRKMIALVVVPDRKTYYNFIFFCEHCKRIDPMPNYG